MVLFKLFLILLCSIPWTIPQAAQHCSSVAVWFWVRVPVISSASITSPCDTVQLPINVVEFLCLDDCPCTDFALFCSETAVPLTAQPPEAVSKEAARRMQWGEAGNPVVALLQQHTLQTQTVDQVESTMAPEVTVHKGPAPKGQAWEIPQKDDKVPMPTSMENMAQTHVVEKKGTSPAKSPSDAVAQNKEEKIPPLSQPHIVKGQDKEGKKEEGEGEPPKKDMDGEPITSEEPHKEDTTAASSVATGKSSSTEGYKKAAAVVSVKTVLDQLQDDVNTEEKAVGQQSSREEGGTGKESGVQHEGEAVVEDDLEIQEYEALLEEEEKEIGAGELQEEVVVTQEVLQKQEQEVDDS